MKAIWLLALVTIASTALSIWSTNATASQLAGIVALACLSLWLATVLTKLMRPSPIPRHRSPTKVALSLAAALLMIPSAVIIAGMSVLFAVPAILVGILFLPPLFWHEHAAEDTHSGEWPRHHHA